MGLGAKSVVIINAICAHGTQSIRSLADRTGLSKRSVHRHRQAMGHRDRSPASSWGETEAGRTWLVRLGVATRLVFGLKRGVGAETLSEFCSRLGLEGHVGGSPSALRGVIHTVARLLLETAAAWENDGIAHGERRPVIGAVDETLLQRMMLGFMDLATGSVVMEEVATDRRFATWDDRSTERLKTFGPEVLSRVSDRAKALRTLAHTGLGCPSIPEGWPLGHDLAPGYSLRICGRLRHAKRDLEHAKQGLETWPKNSEADPTQVAQAQGRGETWATWLHRWQEVGRTWCQHLANVARLVHPWRLADALCQPSNEVEAQGRAERKAMETLLETNGLPRKHDPLSKGQKQRAGMAALVDFWGQTVRQDWTPLAMTPRWTPWAEEGVLPLQYWQAQLHRARCPGQNAQMALVIQGVEEALARHACTRQRKAEGLAGGQAWAGDHGRAFQRTASAVEGRHGSRAQRQHNHRGLPMRRSPVWTALHHCDGRATDGTTPASRFFRRAFPDLFESVLSKIEGLPLPRQRRQALAASH